MSPVSNSSALRKGRVSLKDRYLLTATTQSRIPWFLDFFSARIVVRALRHHDVLGDTHSHAYVVMPDHVHWLFTLTGNRSLDKIMQAAKGYSAYQINATGHAKKIWQAGFHDRAVREEE